MYPVPDQRDEWEDLESAVARLRARPRAARTCKESGADVKRLRRIIDQLELEYAAECGELNTRWAGETAINDEFELDGCESPMMWIRHESKVTGRVASDALAVAENRASLPASVIALEAGRIGFGHLALLAHTAAAITRSPAAAPFDERHLLQQAEKHPFNRFRRDCAHARHAADAAAFLEEHVDVVEERFLQVSTRDDGSVWLRGFIDCVGGAGLRTVLESLARRDGPDDTRTRERRLADALLEVVDHALHSAEIAGGGARAPQLMVTASWDTLRYAPGATAAELEFAGPIPAETARRLACDANVVPVTVDAESRVVDVGRSRRMPTTATRRTLVLRDRGCVWPGCDRPASWTVPHHVLHYAAGGDHNLENLVLLCSRHHWKAHEGGWQLIVTEDRRILTLAPHSDVPRARPPTTGAA